MVLDLTNSHITTSPPLTTLLWKFCGSCWFNWNRPLFASWCTYLWHWSAYLYSSIHGTGDQIQNSTRKTGNMDMMLLGLNGVPSEHVKRSACKQGTQTWAFVSELRTLACLGIDILLYCNFQPDEKSIHDGSVTISCIKLKMCISCLRLSSRMRHIASTCPVSVFRTRRIKQGKSTKVKRTELHSIDINYPTNK